VTIDGRVARSAVTDLGVAGRFSDAIMGALGVPCVARDDDRIGYGVRNGPDDDTHTYISIRPSNNVVPDRRHWCFRAPTRDAVDRFHASGLAAGGQCDGPPGLRDYHPSYYAAFLRDPDGNRVEAVCHRTP
jgi:catechol 2,3-dioxygenase-like lactoylglutathione lyase family enzyme